MIILFTINKYSMYILFVNQIFFFSFGFSHRGDSKGGLRGFVLPTPYFSKKLYIDVLFYYKVF